MVRYFKVFCPKGYHLDSYLKRFKGGSDLSTIFGYGDVINTCKVGDPANQEGKTMDILP